MTKKPFIIIKTIHFFYSFEVTSWMIVILFYKKFEVFYKHRLNEMLIRLINCIINKAIELFTIY